MKEQRKTDLYSVVKQLMRVIAIALSAFQFLTAGFGTLPTLQQRAVHIGFILILIYMQDLLSKKDNKLIAVVDALLTLGCLAASLYTIFNWKAITLRVATPTTADLVLGAFLICAVIYGTKLKLGWPLPILSVIMILYGLFGKYMPSLIRHRGYSVSRIIAQLFMGTEGIYGSVVGISATYIFLFILFGAMMEYSGAAKFFIDLSSSLIGRKQGGSAKVATVASALFGMVSGSATANVVAIGPITTPAMEKCGYTNRFSGAVVAVAGTGGQFMPPIMGAAAFIIAESLAIPYISVAKAAFIPAVLYYAALWIAIDLRTKKENVGSLPESEIPSFREVLSNGFYLALPFLLLIFLMVVMKWSPMKSGFYALVATIITSWFKKATRMGFKKVADAFQKGAMEALGVAIVCSAAGILIGMLSLTGLGMKLSNMLITLSMGNYIILLILTAIVALILGMGMASTSVYIILAVLVAPALVEMGVPVLAAHLFVYYFGILSTITPPVATASFAAASVVKDDPFKLGFTAWRLGLAGYILPFMFVFNQELLCVGEPLAILKCVVTSLIGVYALAVSLEGYMKIRVPIIMRVLLFVAALLLIDSGLLTDVVGLIIMGIALYLYNGFRNIPPKMQKKADNAPTV